MESWIKGIIAFFEALERFSWLFLLTTTVFLCAPINLFDFFTIEPVPDGYKWAVSFVFVAFFFHVVISLIGRFFFWVKRMKAAKDNKNKIKSRIEDQLKSLNEEEKSVIHHCLMQNSPTCSGSSIDPALMSLCARGLMYPASRGNLLNYPFILEDRVWKMIRGLSVDAFDVLYG